MPKRASAVSKQESATQALSREGNDLVIRVKDVFAVAGKPSSTGGSMILASSPGQFYWLRALENVPDPLHVDGCAIALKLTVIKSLKKAGAKKEKGTGPASTMSAMV